MLRAQRKQVQSLGSPIIQRSEEQEWGDRRGTIRKGSRNQGSVGARSRRAAGAWGVGSCSRGEGVATGEEPRQGANNTRTEIWQHAGYQGPRSRGGTAERGGSGMAEEGQWREWVWDSSSEMFSGEGEQRSKREDDRSESCALQYGSHYPHVAISISIKLKIQVLGHTRHMQLGAAVLGHAHTAHSCQCEKSTGQH